MPLPHPLLALAPLVSLAVPQIHGASGAQQAGDVEIVAARTDRYERMTVPVRIAEQPFHFLIDTGAQNTVLSIATAAQLALVPGGRARLIGVAGSQMVDTVEIDQIDLGRRSYYGIVAPLLEGRDIGADGIVGLDSLQDQRVLLDFRNKLMAIGDAKTLGGNSGYEIVVTARRRSGQLIMTNAMIDGVATDVVIDTGAESSIGNRALQRALSRRRGSEQTTLTSVTGQQIVADLGLARELKISSMSLRNVLIAYADAPPFESLGLAKKPAIFLGMRDLRSFNRVAIDFNTRRVMFDLPREAF